MNRPMVSMAKCLLRPVNRGTRAYISTRVIVNKKLKGTTKFFWYKMDPGESILVNRDKLVSCHSNIQPAHPRMLFLGNQVSVGKMTNTGGTQEKVIMGDKDNLVCCIETAVPPIKCRMDSILCMVPKQQDAKFEYNPNDLLQEIDGGTFYRVALLGYGELKQHKMETGDCLEFPADKVVAVSESVDCGTYT